MVQPTLRYDGNAYSLAAWVLVLLFAFKLLVFDFDNGHRATGFTSPIWPAEVLWTMCGLLLAIGLTVLGATVTAALRDVSPHDEYPPLVPKVRDQLRWTMSAAVTLCLLSTCGMQLALKGSGKHVRRLGKTARLVVRACIALLCMLSPLAVQSFSMVAQAAMLALLVVLQVVVDMWARTRVDSLTTRHSDASGTLGWIGIGIGMVGLCAASKQVRLSADVEVCECCKAGGSLWPSCCGLRRGCIALLCCSRCPSPGQETVRDEKAALLLGSGTGAAHGYGSGSGVTGGAYAPRDSHVTAIAREQGRGRASDIGTDGAGYQALTGEDGDGKEHENEDEDITRVATRRPF